MFAIYAGAVLVLLAGDALTKQHTYHLERRTDGMQIHQDITHNEDENTVLIAIGDIPECPICQSTLNFHDFDTGMVAFKHIRGRTCYLTKSPSKEPMTEMYKSGVTTHVIRYEADISHDELTSDTVRFSCGERIAEFCADYTKKMMTLTQEVESGMLDRDMRANNGSEQYLGREPRCAFNCGTCTIIQQIQPKDAQALFG